MNLISKIHQFYRSIRKNLTRERVIFSKREWANVVSEQIELSSFPVFSGASLSLFCAYFLNGESKAVIDILKEFLQFETLALLLYVIAVFVLVSGGLGLIRDKLPNWLPHDVVDRFLNWILYWSFAISSGISALIIGGSLPFYLGFLVDIDSLYKLSISLVIFFITPSLYYLISLVTKPEFKDHCYNKFVRK